MQPLVLELQVSRQDPRLLVRLADNLTRTQQGLAALQGQMNQFDAMIRCDMLNRLERVLNRTRYERGDDIVPMGKRVGRLALVYFFRFTTFLLSAP